MIPFDAKITIVGLGLLGGSYACGFREAGYENVYGIDINEESIAVAKERHWIRDGGSDVKLVKDSDIVVFCLYPHVFVKWIEENQHLLKSNSVITDVTGVKRAVIDRINGILREDIEFIACHPMAGRESKGIAYADTSRFKNANYIVVPTENNSENAIAIAYEIGRILKFGHISELSADEHDRMIGFLSQLTHVIAVSLMNAKDNTHLVDYTGDSFRDLTRIAMINEDMWPELFVLNKDYLVSEIDDFVKEMEVFKQMIQEEDMDGMKQKLIQSTERRREFIKK